VSRLTNLDQLHTTEIDTPKTGQIKLSTECMTRAYAGRTCGQSRDRSGYELKLDPVASSRAVYRDRTLLTALRQGAGLHYVNGTNGVKDLDVYTFYAADPSVGYPYRRGGVEDFGESEHGRHPDEHEFVGRRVNLLGRTLQGRPSADPVAAVRSYLLAGATATAKELAKKAVVAIDPGSEVQPGGVARAMRATAPAPPTNTVEHGTVPSSGASSRYGGVRRGTG